MSFPALALAVAAAYSVTSYTGTRAPFIKGMEISYSRCNSEAEGQPVFLVTAEVHAFAYFDADDVAGES